MGNAVCVAVLMGVVLAGCSSDRAQPDGTNGAEPSAATSTHAHSSTTSGPRRQTSGTCQVDYPPAVLPPWASDGFTPPTQPVPYVLGDHGDVLAVVWLEHHPLQAPKPSGRNNKVLWVVRQGSGEPLSITATRVGTAETVTLLLAGPGPSLVDMPAPGCWSMDVAWGAHRDHLDLAYAPPQ